MTTEVTATPAQVTPEAAKAPETAVTPETVLTSAQAPAETVPATPAAAIVETPAQVPTEKTPVVYDLKLPEGSLLKSEHVEKVTTFAKEQGLSNEHAQALLDRENTTATEAVAGFAENQQAELKTKQDSWISSLKADKEIGGAAFNQNVELSKRVVNKFGTPEFKQALNDSGLGNHPELVRVFARIGKIMAEDQLVLPGAQGGGTKRIEDIFYPNMKKE